MMDNIIASKLYRLGSVGYVSKSGGTSNELINILSIVTSDQRHLRGYRYRW
jgi:ATP citrate (pro-S)-lyase